MVKTVVYVYLAVSVSMIFFNIVCVFLFRKGKDDKVRRRDRKLVREIEKQLNEIEKGGKVSQEHVELLKKRGKNDETLITIDETLENLRNQGHKGAVDVYASQTTELFTYLAHELDRKDDIFRSYFAYLLWKYKVVQNRKIQIIESFLLEMTESHNLYCRENALKAIYTTGNPNLVMTALKIVDAEDVFHHEKLITDGLLSFTGDREQLIDMLLKDRESFTVNMQLDIINFVRFGSGKRCEQMLEILQNEDEDDEIRFSAIRYFGKYPYEPAFDTICTFAEHPNDLRWEYAAISASSLASYQNDRSVEALKTCLHHSNWYIRYNAAVSLESFDLNYMTLADILDGNDRYAREILQYRMDVLKQIKGRSLA